MPTIQISYSDLIKLIGKQIPIDELKELILLIKGEVDDVENDTMTVEFESDRIDMLSVEGIARTLKGFLGIEKGIPQYWIDRWDLTIRVDPSVNSVRPYIVGAVVTDIKLEDKQKNMIKDTLSNISKEVLKQPQNYFVHRDFHSRNIMVKHDGSIGVIDYQDAMSGAITYDLVSLLKDCYIAFERSSIEKLALEFRDKKKLKVDDATFLKWFDFMGLQRQIKVLGIFSRLHIRDNKEGYLKDIPLTLKYVLETAKRYEETQALAKLLKEIQ